MIKKAAMFGLDARIALAIFGALSVISGAALYSAIQQANVIAFVTEYKETEKSLEQLLLDTGIDPSHNKTNASVAIGCLLEDCSISGWQGPYLSNSPGASTNHIDHPKYTNVYLRNILDTDWAHPSDDAGIHYCAADTSKTCYYWIMVNGVDLTMQKAFDEYIDTTAGANTGDVRYSGSELYLKSIPLLNQ